MIQFRCTYQNLKTANPKINSHAEMSNPKPLNHSLNGFTDLNIEGKLFLLLGNWVIKTKNNNKKKNKVRFNTNFINRDFLPY